MPATYKYGFLSKGRERALEAAQIEFYECKKQVKKIEQEAKALSERMVFLGALLGYGVSAIMPDGEMRKKVEAAIVEK
jgi:hypothetical protein